MSGLIRDKKEYKAIKVASIRQKKPNEHYILSPQIPIGRKLELQIPIYPKSGYNNSAFDILSTC